MPLSLSLYKVKIQNPIIPLPYFSCHEFYYEGIIYQEEQRCASFNFFIYDMLTDEELRNKILLEIKSLNEGQYMVVEEHPSYVYSAYPFITFTVSKGKTRYITGGACISSGFSKKAISHLNQENCGRILMFDDAEKYLKYVRDKHIVPRLKRNIREKHLLTDRLMEFSKTWSGKRVAPESLSSPNEEIYFIAVTVDLSDYYYMYWSPTNNLCTLETCCGYPKSLTDAMLPKELEESMIKRVKDTIFDAILPCNYREIETVHV